ENIRRLSEEEVVLLTTVLFLGGFQTTSITLSFMSLLLAMHPEVQEKVRQEVKAAIESSGRLDYDTTMHKLKYTTQVMNETLRLYPPSLT
ncbi:cytochrome P450, putative, partial [Ixodes scapularis]